MGTQVFQTNNTNRWTHFKWSMRLFLFIVVILLVALAIMLFIDKTPNVPFKRDYRKVVAASGPLWQESKLSKAYKGFRDVIKEHKMHGNYAAEKRERQAMHKFAPHLADTSGRNRATAYWKTFPAGIRSAFYVAWDPQSLFSLRRNIHNLNLVFPEWFFIDPVTDSLKTNVDEEGFALMKRSGVAIMPMLSNNFDREFRSEGIGRILHSSEKRKQLINTVLQQCLVNHFAGINVDFEELKESSDEYLIGFMKELSEAFHQKGLLVSQDIMPFNTDYNLRELARYNDYMVLMAYDEYSGDSDPGPISSQRWTEAALDNFAKKVPAEKNYFGAWGFWLRLAFTARIRSQRYLSASLVTCQCQWRTDKV
ncbi:MAG: glycosyl hydrolase family 18 protein [Niabella sp.]